MRRRTSLVLLGFAACAPAVAQGAKEPGAAIGQAATASLTEIIRTHVQITGVAVSSKGRVFVCSPNWHEGHTWSVAERVDGTLSPFPAGEYNRWVEGAEKNPEVGFVCVQSVLCDANDHLWVLDPASPKMSGTVRGSGDGGGPKVVRIDLATNKVVRVYPLGAGVVPTNGYANDLRVDLARNVAYITDSGTGAIILLDIERGHSARYAQDMASLKADPAVVPEVGGRALRKADGTALVVHSDGIAIDAAGEWVYVQALTSRTLHRISTTPLRALLAGDDGAADRVKAATEYLGETVVTDGMEMDAAGTLYFTALERDAIMYRTPDGALRTLAQDAAIAWPDSIALHNGELYFTTSQIHRTAWFSPDGSNPTTPYMVYKVGMPGK